MDDDFFDIGWEEMALIGSLSETLADGEREMRRLEKEMEQEDCDCCSEDPPDEEPCP